MLAQDVLPPALYRDGVHGPRIVCPGRERQWERVEWNLDADEKQMDSTP